MKKILLPLVLAMASSSVMAADENGRITFRGYISAGGTCPIEVVDPGLGVQPWVFLGNYATKAFPTVGTETKEVAFGLRVTPDASCVIAPGTEATVKFDALAGVEGTDMYALNRGGATGLGLLIKDDTGATIDPNTESKKYALAENTPTEMRFFANYKSSAATVGAGMAEADVNFVVALP
ncbi:type 1 fimbrial protein [Pantoea sp. Tr-811]|uniref:fimbrial protein n=1 Tax=unclassified Pantoea TaxID=2630326 RepID=UPI00142126C6|nr:MULTISPECIES: fimbrial protein [unclassified Pantoea]NIE73830.1 type 1 fimbrial protein [Pantoea sp. Ap-967]NIF30290.1 type 1 fimbrial protein [Pantoea sp. Tr-811]